MANGRRRPPSRFDQRDAQHDAEHTVEGARVRHGVEMRADEQPRRGRRATRDSTPRRLPAASMRDRHARPLASTAPRRACTSRIGAERNVRVVHAGLFGAGGERRGSADDLARRCRAARSHSRAPVGAVAVRREQQRHVVVAAGSAIPTRITTSSRNGGSGSATPDALQIGGRRGTSARRCPPRDGRPRASGGVGAAVGVGRPRTPSAVRPSAPTPMQFDGDARRGHAPRWCRARAWRVAASWIWRLRLKPEAAVRRPRIRVDAERRRRVRQSYPTCGCSPRGAPRRATGCSASIAVPIR